MLLKRGMESGGQIHGKHNQTGGIIWAMWEMANGKSLVLLFICR